MNMTPRTLAALLLACTAIAAHADNRAYRNTSLGNLEFTSPSKNIRRPFLQFQRLQRYNLQRVP